MTPASRTTPRMKMRGDGVVQEHFRPEFINRIDEIVVFHPLGSDADPRDRATSSSAYLRKRLAKRDMRARRSTTRRSRRSREAGFDPVYGARPLKRAIQQQIENPLAQAILAGRFGPKDVIPVDVIDGEFSVRAHGALSLAGPRAGPSPPGSSRLRRMRSAVRAIASARRASKFPTEGPCPPLPPRRRTPPRRPRRFPSSSSAAAWPACRSPCTSRATHGVHRARQARCSTARTRLGAGRHRRACWTRATAIDSAHRRHAGRRRRPVRRSGHALHRRARAARRSNGCSSRACRSRATRRPLACT